ncbi:TPA: hypothetical protein ROY17_005746 [Bacillus thuringiensis]|nr:hypothetical protein [Bacillus thuringiensis]
MKKQVKILLTAGVIVTPAFFTSIVSLPSVSLHAYANTAETFDKVEMDLIDRSKDVIKKETEAWKKDLKSDVKTVIDNISKESDLKTITKINTELRQGDETKSKDTIEKLDAALRTAPVTKENTKVYMDVSLKNDFDVSKDNVKTGETVITENGYIKGGLARNTSASTSEVIELTIPKGEHMANMTASGSTTISYNELLERGRSFVITAKKEIKDMGKTRTKIEATLLPKKIENTKTEEFSTRDEAQTYLENKFGEMPLTDAELDLLSNPDRLTDVNNKLDFSRNIDSNLISSSAKNDIKVMDNMFISKAAKTEAPMVVYIPLPENELGVEEGNFDIIERRADGSVVNTTKIETANFKELEGNFQYGVMNTFRVADVVKPASITTPVVLKLTIPVGTPVLYGGGTDILLPRDKGINISNAAIMKNSKNSGREEFIQLEGTIVSKAEITNKVMTAEANLNKEFQEITGIKNQNLVSLKIDGLYASNMVKRAQILLYNLAESVPAKVVVNVLKKMDHDGTLIFTDKSLINYDNQASPGALGIYRPEEKKLYVEINHPDILPFKRIQDISSGKMLEDEITLRHEFMHAVDDLLLNGTIISNTPELKSLYNTYTGKFEKKLADIIQRETDNSLSTEQLASQIYYKILDRGRLTGPEIAELQKKIEKAANTRMENEDILDIVLYIEDVMHSGVTTDRLTDTRNKIEHVINKRLTELEAASILQLIKDAYLPENQINNIKQEMKNTFSEDTYQYKNEKEFWAVLGEKYFSSNPSEKQQFKDEYPDVSHFMDEIFAKA